MSPILWYKCQRVFSSSSTPTRHAGRFDWLRTSFIMIIMDNGRGHSAWWQSFPNKSTEELKTKRRKCMLQNKFRSGQNTRACYLGHGWFSRVNLLTYQPALAWPACPDILHKFNLYNTLRLTQFEDGNTKCIHLKNDLYFDSIWFKFVLKDLNQ